MIDDDLAHTAEALAAMRAEVERLRNLGLLLWPSPSPSLHYKKGNARGEYCDNPFRLANEIP
jgi:hypothetical protein